MRRVVAPLAAVLVAAVGRERPALAAGPHASRDARTSQGGSPPTQDRSRDCNLQVRPVFVKGVPTSTITALPASPGRSNYFAGGGVDAICANTDQRVLSDSAEQFGDLRVLVLIGHVHYSEQRVDLYADRVTYFMGEERLLAEGNVKGRTNTGTHFTGPRATYLRAKPGLRAVSRLDAGGRPDTWISGADAGTETPARDSTHVLADSIISLNDSLIYATGSVHLTRSDMTAHADSAMIDQGREIAALRQQPQVDGIGERRFRLVGDAIDIYSRNRQAERVRSSGAASATSDDVSLTADSIDLRLANRQLTRAVAWGKRRAHATQPGRDIVADSIDVTMPGQVIRGINAIGRARAESAPDSTKVRTRERDWFTGDTILATFDSATVRDSSRAAIRRLVSIGHARSWQFSARDGATLPDTAPVINYVTGSSIMADFDDQRALDRVRVNGQASGVIVQPATDTTRRTPAPRRPPESPR